MSTATAAKTTTRKVRETATHTACEGCGKRTERVLDDATGTVLCAACIDTPKVIAPCPHNHARSERAARECLEYRTRTGHAYIRPDKAGEATQRRVETIEAVTAELMKTTKRTDAKTRDAVAAIVARIVR